MFSTRFRASVRPTQTMIQCLRQRQLPPKPMQRLPQQRLRSSARPSPSFKQTVSTLFRENPTSMSTACVVIAFGVISIFYLNQYYNNYIIGYFAIYPPEVAKHLRKALWYKNYEKDYKSSLKCFKEALRVADELNLDSFGDEVIGIRLEVADLCRSNDRFQQEIGVLEIVKSDILKWLEINGDKEEARDKRMRLIKRAIEVSVKLGQCYEGEYVMQWEPAETHLVWAVETMLREHQRQGKETAAGDEKVEWMSPEEIGGTFESLGHFYEGRNQHDFAAPLFLQAITQAVPANCHTVVLMNNLATSLAQQNLPQEKGKTLVNREALVANARVWANKAIAISSKLAPPERTEECDIGCAVATHNLGEFAEMIGDFKEARKRFEEARGLSKGLWFKEGIENAEAGLKRLGGQVK